MAMAKKLNDYICHVKKNWTRHSVLLFYFVTLVIYDCLWSK